MNTDIWIAILAMLALMCVGAWPVLRRCFLARKTRKRLPRQPIPDVTQDDVERIVRRDFPAVRVQDIIAILGELDNKWKSARVQLAALKLANGSLKVLKKSVAAANQDYRDVIVAAEHPGYWKAKHHTKLSREKRQQIVDADWRRYESWLRK
jgi:hypothetical protein